MDLAEDIYSVSRSFPKDELYGLTAQMRRSSVSVASNIAEGFGRDSRGSFAQFLKMAQGSLKELETQELISVRIGMVAPEDSDRLLRRFDEAGKMLRSLIRTVQNKQEDE